MIKILKKARALLVLLLAVVVFLESSCYAANTISVTVTRKHLNKGACQILGISYGEILRGRYYINGVLSAPDTPIELGDKLKFIPGNNNSKSSTAKNVNIIERTVDKRGVKGPCAVLGISYQELLKGSYYVNGKRASPDHPIKVGDKLKFIPASGTSSSGSDSITEILESSKWGQQTNWSEYVVIDQSGTNPTITLYNGNGTIIKKDYCATGGEGHRTRNGTFYLKDAKTRGRAWNGYGKKEKRNPFYNSVKIPGALQNGSSFIHGTGGYLSTWGKRSNGCVRLTDSMLAAVKSHYYKGMKCIIKGG